MHVRKAVVCDSILVGRCFRDSEIYGRMRILYGSGDSSVDIATGLWLDGRCSVPSRRKLFLSLLGRESDYYLHLMSRSRMVEP
jgi:hypothetical protein